MPDAPLAPWDGKVRLPVTVAAVAHVNAPAWFQRLVDVEEDDSLDDKGRYRVTRTEKLKAMAMQAEFACAVKLAEQQAGVSKVASIRQTANVTQNFQMPRKLFESLTAEQKQMLVDEARALVPVPAEVR